MKALSVRQPWANMIASGAKTIETRVWATEYRGTILIVSSKTPKIAPAGYAVAIAEIADCREMTPEDEKAACCAIYPDAHAWVLRNVRAIKPFPVTGKLGLYNVDVPATALVPKQGESLFE